MWDRLASLAGRLRPVLATVTAVGWTVLGLCLLTWVVAAWLDWGEMAVVATACLVLLVACGFFMLGRTRIRVHTVVEPPRVSAGEPLTGELVAGNLARVPLMSVSLEFPIGEGGVTYDLPTLLPGHEHRELFVVPTQRRGIIPVGPVRTVRGDPLGLFRREQDWTEVTEVYVHPRITALPPFGVGLIRDLEGTTAQNVSQSDLAFHALREYVPGDDLRHVHWRSSAHHGELLVRQFLDTRRSHLVVVVDSDPAAYLSEEDYETAISVGGSLLRRGLLDEYDVSFLSGDETSVKVGGRSSLDGCSRAVPQPRSVVDVAARGGRMVPDASLAVLVTGPHTDFVTLQRAAAQFPVEAATAAVTVDGTRRGGLRRVGDLPLMTLGELDQLAGVLTWGLQ